MEATAFSLSSSSSSSRPVPHVLIFPLQAQGHVNSMLKLAELLGLAGIKVTFLNSEYNHEQLVRHSDIIDRFRRYTGFEFRTIWDGLSEEYYAITGEDFMVVFTAMRLNTKPLFRELLVGARPPVDCIIGDGILDFVSDIAEELDIPLIHFRTVSACSFWAYFCISDMVAAGELPIKGNEDMDRLITTVPGMETFLRCRDLPSFCRVNDLEDPILQLVMTQTRQSAHIPGLLLNTFEELEGPILSKIREHCPNIYTVGPLHDHLKSRMISKNTKKMTSRSSSLSSHSQSANSLREIDRSCMEWLDKQPMRSVVYVSFGSIAVVTREQLMEIWHGLVNSNQRFLWVIRPDSVADGKISADLIAGTEERGYMVGWAPQEEVLGHSAIAGFLTHSGWNSTLESIVAGVPMICWPYFADQQVNSRFVSEVWKLGVDMKDVCDRNVVEKLVRDLTVNLGRRSVSEKMAKLAKNTVTEGGSSYCNLDRLIRDIRLISLHNRNSHDHHLNLQPQP